MKRVLKIDNLGYFVEDVILQGDEITPSGCIEVECPEGFYKPKFDKVNSKWIEGLTPAEVDELNKPKPQEPTTKERLAALELAHY